MTCAVLGRNLRGRPGGHDHGRTRAPGAPPPPWKPPAAPDGTVHDLILPRGDGNGFWAARAQWRSEAGIQESGQPALRDPVRKPVEGFPLPPSASLDRGAPSHMRAEHGWFGPPGRRTLVVESGWTWDRAEDVLRRIAVAALL
jgi:hypothetical protein